MSFLTRKKFIIPTAVLLVLFGVFALLHYLSKSSTYQFFGEIYPCVETESKVVALTFDDGPTRGRTDEILLILREENVKATFYLIGGEIEENAGEAEKIVADGHEIGNHSYSHERMLLVSPAFVREEVERTDALIRGSGYAGEITFRPPYGKKLFALPYYLSENGRKTITWDVAPERTFKESSEEIIDFTLANAKSGSIILLHVAYSNRGESMKSVRPIIRGLRERGFEFKTVSDLLALRSQN